MIELITRYRFDGKEFNSLPDVAKYIENEIGKIVDTPLGLSIKERLAVFEALVKHRKRLTMLLSAEFDREPDELQGDTKSIFDL